MCVWGTSLASPGWLNFGLIGECSKSKLGAQSTYSLFLGIRYISRHAAALTWYRDTCFFTNNTQSVLADGQVAC